MGEKISTVARKVDFPPICTAVNCCWKVAWMNKSWYSLSAKLFRKC